jgi:hypothetical protein
MTKLRRLLLGAWLISAAPVVAAQVVWPDLANRIGPYSGVTSADDASAAVRDGFNLTVQSAYDPAVLKQMGDSGINHIDIQFWAYIYAQCKAQFERQAATGTARHCALSEEQHNAILAQAADRLEKVKDDPTVAAYWALDDYPWGDISATLNALHKLVAKANEETHAHKPVICGIGGSLDHRTATDPRIRPDRTYIQLSLSNLSPAACDVVAPYFYGAATENNPSWVDWSMSNLMPWFMQQLHAKGFNDPPLLPVLHAFYAGRRGGTTYYIQPRPQDMVAQARTYCASGAIALMFFTWRAADAERSYVNDPDLREGVKEAAIACRHAGLALPELP